MPEEELEDHKKDFAELLRPAKCRFYRMMNSGEIKPGTDVVVFDYLTANTDRWGGDNANVLTRGRGGPLVFLDNGAGFPPNGSAKLGKDQGTSVRPGDSGVADDDPAPRRRL